MVTVKLRAGDLSRITDMAEVKGRSLWADARKRFMLNKAAVASRLNKTMMDYVHDVKTGQWVGPAAYRGDRLRGILPVPESLPWWNVERFA